MTNFEYFSTLSLFKHSKRTPSPTNPIIPVSIILSILHKKDDLAFLFSLNKLKKYNQIQYVYGYNNYFAFSCGNDLRNYDNVHQIIKIIVILILIIQQSNMN